MSAQVVRVKSVGQIVEESWSRLHSLEETTEAIKREMYDVASHYVCIGYLLWQVRASQAYRRNGASYADVYEYAADQLGFKRTTVKNLIGIAETFGNRYYGSSSCSILPTPELKPAYKDFNYSQLTEMLSMSEKQRSEVTPDMSVRQIREIKKVAVSAPEPEFPLEPQYETTPIELPGSEPEPAAGSVGQTSDRSYAPAQSAILNNIWHDLPPHILQFLCKEAGIRYSSKSCFDVTIKLHPKNFGC